MGTPGGEEQPGVRRSGVSPVDSEKDFDFRQGDV